VAERVEEHQGPFALPQVAADLLAVVLGVRPEVQEVVGDLEGRAEVAAEGFERPELCGRRTGGDCADLHGRDERVPAGLQLDHLEVVGVPELPGVGPDPLQLDGLALDGQAGHAGDGPKNAQRGTESDALDVVQEGLQRQRQHGVAHVDGDRDAVVDVEGRPAAAQDRLVLDVVVDQEGVVVQLQRRRGREDGFEPPAQAQARRDAQRGPQRLTPAERVVEDQVEEAARRPAAAGEEPSDLVRAQLVTCSEVIVECRRGHLGVDSQV
jgi:hypothetical protein